MASGKTKFGKMEEHHQNSLHNIAKCWQWKQTGLIPDRLHSHYDVHLFVPDAGLALADVDKSSMQTSESRINRLAQSSDTFAVSVSVSRDQRKILNSLHSIVEAHLSWHCYKQMNRQTDGQTNTHKQTERHTDRQQHNSAARP